MTLKLVSVKRFERPEIFYSDFELDVILLQASWKSCVTI